MANSNRSSTGVPQLNRHWETYAEVGTSETLPQLAHDTALTPAGPWAAMIKRYQFKVATPIGFMGHLVQVANPTWESSPIASAMPPENVATATGASEAALLMRSHRRRPRPRKSSGRRLLRSNFDANDERLSLIAVREEMNERRRKLKASANANTERVISMQEQKLRTNIAIRAPNVAEITSRSADQDVDLVNCRNALWDAEQEFDAFSTHVNEILDRWESFSKVFL
ncbi:hypothetical protein N7451_000515 [Penicillium sp. IBT 35674x]|nr:hypothetical protein N7451_000515 [Penicillium sp. IBT 35674x]